MRKVKYTNWWDARKAEQPIVSALAKMDLFNSTRHEKSKVIDEKLLFEAAKHAHENELVYYVTILDEETPYCYLEINRGFYRVCFLDELSRKYMSYDFTDNFKKIRSDKLFLISITFWEFDGVSDDMVRITDHHFKPDGTFVMVERDLTNNEQITSEAEDKIDVTANWEDYPEFGKYDSITRIERG